MAGMTRKEVASIIAQADGGIPYLAGLDLSGLDLTGLDLRGAHLAGANLAGANLSRVDLSRNRQTESAAILVRVNLAGARLAGAKLAGVNLAGADLTGADLSEADLANVNLAPDGAERAKLAGANLTGADLRGANLTSADLRGADLAGARMEDAILYKAELDDATRASARLAAVLVAACAILLSAGACDRPAESPRPAPPVAPAAAHPKEFTDANFAAEVLKSDQPVLVDFWAAWCPPCRQLAPVIDALAKDYGGKVKVGKLNVDSEKKTARTYEIQGIPAVFLFKDGKVVDQIIGLHPKSRYQDAIQRHVR